MKDVKIRPFMANHGLGKTTKLDVFPDTGCQQTLVAEDLVSACGLVLDQTKKKKVKSVDGNRVPCSGSTSFQATYGGETTNVLALVTPALNKEVILSWRTLQRLKVIPKDFPSPVPLHVKAATSKAEKGQSNLVKTERNRQKFRLALREYRNTPRFDGLSPSQWLKGYRQPLVLTKESQISS